MTATLAASAAILKTKYPNGELPKVLYKNNPAWALLKKSNDFDGANEVVALQTDATQGASANFTRAQTNIAQSVYNQFLLTRIEDFSVARITGQALRAARKNTGALVDLWTNEIDSATHQAMRSLAISMFRNGTGVRGQISSGSNVATATITLAQPSDITNFAVGMVLRSSQYNATTSSNSTFDGLRTGRVTISAIDRAAGTLTTAGGNWGTQFTSGAASDYLIRDGDEPTSDTGCVVVSGIQQWIEGGTSPAALFGLTRTSDPVRYAGQAYNATGVPMEEAIIEACARVVVEGGRPDKVFVHPRDKATLVKSLGSKVIYSRVESDVAGIGFGSIKVEADSGPVDVIGDMNVPRNEAVVTQWDTWEFRSLGPAPHILDYDSNQFLRTGSADSYEVRIGTYGNLKCTAPAYNIRVTNFGA